MDWCLKTPTAIFPWMRSGHPPLQAASHAPRLRRDLPPPPFGSASRSATRGRPPTSGGSTAGIVSCRKWICSGPMPAVPTNANRPVQPVHFPSALCLRASLSFRFRLRPERLSKYICAYGRWDTCLWRFIPAYGRQRRTKWRPIGSAFSGFSMSGWRLPSLLSTFCCSCSFATGTTCFTCWRRLRWHGG